MKRVHITDYIEEPQIEKAILSDELSLDWHRDLEVLLVWHMKIDATALDGLPKLRGIIRYGVGFDNIDLITSKERGIFVANTPDYGTDEVADTALAFILNISRGISRYDYQCRKYVDSWQEHTLNRLERASQMRIGVIGAGRIGSSVILRLKACNFQLAFFDPYKDSGYEKVLGVERTETLDELLSNSDIVTIHVPLTTETRGMVNENFLSKMKQGSSIVNTARGGIIESLNAIHTALKSGHLQCAGLDVLPEEPPTNHALVESWRNREEWLDGRLLINPHTAYYSRAAFCEMRESTAKNALRVLRGQRPINIVNGL